MVPVFSAVAQQKTKKLTGMYFQWGYNTEWYTKSNLHFRMSNGDDFTIHKAKAHDEPGMDAVLKSPLEISIPQYNYRLGFYLDKARMKSLELNFDHAKYKLTKYQQVRVTGTINGIKADGDSIIDPTNFLIIEHTDGANWLHLNYTQQTTILHKKTSAAPLLNFIWKLGAGINIPRTDFTYKGDRLNNKFHVAGYNTSVESGARLYIFKKVFLEGTAKTGYVKYVNALANTTTSSGNRVSHSFGYFELIALGGVDIPF